MFGAIVMLFTYLSISHFPNFRTSNIKSYELTFLSGAFRHAMLKRNQEARCHHVSQLAASMGRSAKRSFLLIPASPPPEILQTIKTNVLYREEVGSCWTVEGR